MEKVDASQIHTIRYLHINQSSLLIQSDETRER